MISVYGLVALEIPNAVIENLRSAIQSLGRTTGDLKLHHVRGEGKAKPCYTVFALSDLDVSGGLAFG
jgi:hypothetical protein